MSNEHIWLFVACVLGLIMLGRVELRWYSRRRPCGESCHKFEPRYDSVGPVFEATDLRLLLTSVDGVEALIALQEKRYLHDVCVYCGKTVNRQIGSQE